MNLLSTAVSGMGSGKLFTCCQQHKIFPPLLDNTTNVRGLQGNNFFLCCNFRIIFLSWSVKHHTAGGTGIVQVWAPLFFSPGGSKAFHTIDPGATSNEAHVSAAQKETQEYTRISGEDAEQRWPQGSVPPPCPRSEEAYRERRTVGEEEGDPPRTGPLQQAVRLRPSCRW